MSYSCSICKAYITLLLCLFIAFASCKDNKNSEVTNKDTVRTDTSSGNLNLSDSAQRNILGSAISDFSLRNNASDNWTLFRKENKTEALRTLKDKNLVFPLFKEQISYLHKTDATDTVLVYYGDKSNAFVINITGGKSLFDKLKEESNGLMAVKVISIEYSQKLYLIKKYTDFQHKEKNVTEFYINAELADAVNTGVNEKLLKEKFRLEE